MRTRYLRIGIDARAAAEVPAGRGRYVRELVRALLALEGDHRLVLFGRRSWPLPGTRWVLLPAPDPVWSLQAGLVARRHCDLVHASNSHLMCAAASVPAVAVVHDLFGFSAEFGVPPLARAERATLSLAARNAAGFICPTEATRGELVRRFPGVAGRTRVVPDGVTGSFSSAEPAGVPERHGIEKPYVLFVGTLEPRKNVPRLIEAFASLPAPLLDEFELVLVGAQGWATEQTDQARGSAGARVRALGYVDDEDLPSLYAGATAFAYPSLAEGFGLPVLEAMAAGTPVLTSDRSALPEVAGGAACLVDPASVAAIRAGLESLLTDAGLRQRLVRLGRAQAAEYTWERTATETLAYLTSVASTFAAGNRRESPVSS